MEQKKLPCTTNYHAHLQSLDVIGILILILPSPFYHGLVQVADTWTTEGRIMIFYVINLMDYLKLNIRKILWVADDDFLY